MPTSIDTTQAMKKNFTLNNDKSSNSIMAASLENSLGNNHSMPITVLRQPSTLTNRRILERRKALQDFYTLAPGIPNTEQRYSGSNELDVNVKSGLLSDSLDDSLQFKSSQEFDTFMSNASIEQILHCHNTIAARLDAHDSSKKAMIYDNYYQLIQLSETLHGISSPANANESPRDPMRQRSTTMNSLDEFDSLMTNLELFTANTVPIYDLPFAIMMQNSCPDPINTIYSPSLISEITTLLNIDPSTLNSDVRKRLFNQVSEILTLVENNSLIYTQLNRIKNGLNID